MWLVTTYRHTAPFSLRTSSSTSTGGKTNLVPTMYTLKMALIDAAFRMGLQGEAVFEWIKPLDVRFAPPSQALVTNSFIKVMTEPKDKKDGPAFISSIGFREFVMYDGEMKVAVDMADLSEPQVELLRRLLLHIQHLGKRGSFVQPVDQQEAALLGSEYHALLGEQGELHEHVCMQYLDDMGSKASFDSISSFSDAGARLGRDREMKSVFIPYQMRAASRGYTWYCR